MKIPQKGVLPVRKKTARQGSRCYFAHVPSGEDRSVELQLLYPVRRGDLHELITILDDTVDDIHTLSPSFISQ
jgi:hypothetical protein